MRVDRVSFLATHPTRLPVFSFLSACFSQAIHCRSLMPSQDTPSNKFTYSATVEVDAPLVALMSAKQTGVSSKSATRSEFSFAQPEPIPSYLLALAVGALDKREIGPRSHVWSEPAMVEAGAYEFANTEKFLAAGEAICGPYSWGHYVRHRDTHGHTAKHREESLRRRPPLMAHLAWLSLFVLLSPGHFAPAAVVPVWRHGGEKTDERKQREARTKQANRRPLRTRRTRGSSHVCTSMFCACAFVLPRTPV